MLTQPMLLSDRSRKHPLQGKMYFSHYSEGSTPRRLSYTYIAGVDGVIAPKPTQTTSIFVHVTHIPGGPQTISRRKRL